MVAEKGVVACYLLLATLPKTLGGCYAKLPKTESLYALRSSEICTVSNVVTVDLHRLLRPEKGNIQDASEDSEEKET